MKLKKVFAVLLSTVILGTTAFGQTKEESNKVRFIAYNEAVELAIKNNTELKNIKDNLELLEEGRQKLSDGLMGQVYMQAINPNMVTYMDSGPVSLLTSLNSVETSIKSIGISEEIVKESCKMVVKNYMTEIDGLDEKISMMKDTISLNEKNLEYARLKKSIGVISESEYLKIENDLKMSKLSLELLRLTLDTTYNSLGRLLNINEDFRVNYTISYEPYPEISDLDTFVNRVVAKDPSLKIEDYKISDAQFQKNYVAYDATTSYKERENKVVTASRDYKDKKADLELAIKNSYTAVKQSEINIESLEIALEQAREDYKNVKLSQSVGYATDIQVIGARLALKKAEGDLNDAKRKHELAVFSIERPYLASGAGR